MRHAAFSGAKPAGAALAMLVRAYQLLLRPILPPACRFEPSCSTYAMEALRTHGAASGLLLAAWRVLRCNPWGGCGHDPVPPCRHTHRPAHAPETKDVKAS